MPIDIELEALSVPPSPTSQLPSAAKTPDDGRTKVAAWKRIVLAVGVLVVLGAVAAALVPKFMATEPQRLLTHEVQPGDLVVSVTEQGTLESSSNVEIKCRVKGGSTVLSVVESGTEVQPGDVLIRLDQSTIEDTISQQRIAYETAISNKATSESDVAVAKIGITEYLEGTFRSQRTTMQKDVVIAESNLKSAQNALAHAERMFHKGYSSQLDLEAQQDAVRHAELELEVKQTDLRALEKFTKAKELETYQGLLKIAEANLAANEAALELERARLERAEDQLKNCVIVAERAGMVIYPSAAEWKEQPDIEEGASVREDQILLMMPDLDAMQVKVGIHESKVDRLEIGMPARVQLSDGFAEGKVVEIASMSKGGGWWTGNMVKYDTIVKLDNESRLKPGMSVSVEIFLAKHTNVLTVPVAAILELQGEYFCWIDAGNGEPEKRAVQVGDSNDTFIVVHEGLHAGDLVVLNPGNFVTEAETAVLEAIEERAAPEDVPEVEGSNSKSQSNQKSPPKQNEKPGKSTNLTGAAILKMADQNKDGVLTEDEVDARGKQDFSKNDANGDGKLDAKELDVAIERSKSAAKK